MHKRKNEVRVSKELQTIIIISLIIASTVIPIKAISSNSILDLNDNRIITLEEASDVAQGKIQELGKTDIYSIKTWNIVKVENTKQNLFYLFHLSPKGYVIVAPVRDINPIIAYSLTSDTFINGEINPLYNLVVADISIQLEQISSTSNQIKNKYHKEWSYLKQLNLDLVTNKIIEQWPPEGTTETEGWIKTQWHQNAPYNNFCPIDTSSGQRGIAGCPAVAMAQIINYHKTTNNIQFNDSDDYHHNYLNKFWIDDDYEAYDFPSFPFLNGFLNTLSEHYQTQTLITDDDKAAINFACGVAATQVYSPQVSGTFGVNQAFNAYKRFNFNTSTLYTESSEEMFNKIIWNIKHALPVHFAVVTPAWDTGHNLIIDGYNTDEYYHLNFGWDGMHDGWYHIPSNLPYELTVIEGVIVDIMNISTAEDLECTGQISLTEVIAGDTINDSFSIENIGDPASLLAWQVITIPSWGSWNINPDNGNNLTPEYGQLTVNISVVLPDKKNREFTGSIEIINLNNPSDRGYIPVSISTSKTKEYINIFEKLEIINHPIIYFLLNFLIKNTT